MATCVIPVYRKNIIIFNAEYKLTIPTYNIDTQISCFNVLQSKTFNLLKLPLEQIVNESYIAKEKS